MGLNWKVFIEQQFSQFSIDKLVPLEWLRGGWVGCKERGFSLFPEQKITDSVANSVDNRSVLGYQFSKSRDLVVF